MGTDTVEVVIQKIDRLPKKAENPEVYNPFAGLPRERPRNVSPDAEFWYEATMWGREWALFQDENLPPKEFIVASGAGDSEMEAVAAMFVALNAAVIHALAAGATRK